MAGGTSLLTMRTRNNAISTVLTVSRSHAGQADSGVAGGGLDDHRAGLEQAPGLGVVDHGLADPVLYGAGGVEILQLGQDPGLEIEFLFNVGELQKRSAADELIGRGVDPGHDVFSFYHEFVFYPIPYWNGVFIIAPSRRFVKREFQVF